MATASDQESFGKVTTFAFENGRIRAIYIVSNPEKLAGVPATLIAELTEDATGDQEPR